MSTVNHILKSSIIGTAHDLADYSSLHYSERLPHHSAKGQSAGSLSEHILELSGLVVPHLHPCVVIKCVLAYKNTLKLLRDESVRVAINLKEISSSHFFWVDLEGSLERRLDKLVHPFKIDVMFVILFKVFHSIMSVSTAVVRNIVFLVLIHKSRNWVGDETEGKLVAAQISINLISVTHIHRW